jgi:hypothetical protein
MEVPARCGPLAHYAERLKSARFAFYYCAETTVHINIQTCWKISQLQRSSFHGAGDFSRTIFIILDTNQQFIVG